MFAPWRYALKFSSRRTRTRRHNRRVLLHSGIEALEDRVLLSAGDIEWTLQFGAPGPAADRAEAVDAGGNVYLAGRTDGTLPGQTSAGGVDAFVRKYDSNGTVQWTRQFGTASSDRGSVIFVDASGVYVAGLTEGSFPSHSNAGGRDVYVRKYDSNGTELWTRQFGTSGTDDARGLSVDASGVYVAGVVGVDSSLPGQTSAGSHDVFVRKYDLNGTELWTDQFGGSSSDRANSLSVDISGVYVAGRTDSSLPGQTSAGGRDAFVRKYDSNGTEVWTRQFGTSASDRVTGISVDASGVYLAGFTGGSLPGQASAGDNDPFVRKYDVNGTEVWTRQFGTSANDAAVGISVDASGVYVAGFTAGSLPGQTSAGGDDAFARKYDVNGTEVWTQQFGTSSTDRASAISVDFSGVFVAGRTDGNLPGQTSAGGTDAFVAKLVKDRDNDGISDPVDTLISTFSNDFSDSGLGGQTDGTITDRGDQILTVTEEAHPNGVRIKADLSGGLAPANISVNGGASTFSLDAGDEVVVTHSSVTLEVIAGIVEVVFVADNGQIGTSSIGAGNSVTFDPETITFTAASTNMDTVIVLVDGTPISLDPGATGLLIGIDIKPGSSPNSINLGSKGSVPVAIFSTLSFDATTIDPTTVTFAEAQVRLRGRGTPMASMEDVNGDGLLDLVVHVETEALQLTETDSQAELLGETFDGVSIVGTDSIRVVAALHVAGGPAEGVFVGNGLTHATLNSVVQQSLAYWAAAGVESHRLNALTQLDVQITDLSDSLLGLSAINRVWIDRDAAGYGWSVNSGGVDLYSAVTHEFGHVLGLRHHDDHAVMGKTLGAGVRQFASSSFSTSLNADEEFGSLRNPGSSAGFGLGRAQSSNGSFSLSGGQDSFDTFGPTSFSTHQDATILTTTTLDKPFETLVLLFDHERHIRILDAEDGESDLTAKAARLVYRRATEAEEVDHLFAEFQESLAEAI